MRKKNPSSDDSELFRQAVGKVRQIENNKVAPLPPNKPKPYPKPQAIDLEADFFASALAVSDLDKLGLGDTMTFLAPGLQNNVLKKMRQGQYGLDASLDLHGLNSNDAKRELLAFLNESIARRYRCIHIIHGKGYRSEDNHPVLKNHLNIWLRQHHSVLAFCSAPVKDGGSGAVFVLLQVK